MNAPNYEERAMYHFATMPREEQEATIRRLAASGMGEQTIARATRLTVELIRRVLSEAGVRA